MFKLTYISTKTDYPYIFEFNTLDDALAALAPLAISKDCYRLYILDMSKNKKYIWEKNACGDFNFTRVENID